jgi:hypothetical protein
MCSPSQLSSFQSLFDSALQDYQKRTKLRLLDHPLAKELEKCDSVDSITAVLQRKARDINQYRGDDGRIMKSVKCTVQVLCTLSTSTVLGECIGLVRPDVFVGILIPDIYSTAITGGEGNICRNRYLTRCMSPSSFLSPHYCDIQIPQAVKSVTESYDELLDLLGSFENFLCRLEIYTRIPPNEAAALGDILVKIMAELLFTLALATKQIKQGRLSEFVPVDVGQD